ncbi:hypothetical protein [Azospirillum argentinense]
MPRHGCAVDRAADWPPPVSHHPVFHHKEASRTEKILTLLILLARLIKGILDLLNR